MQCPCLKFQVFLWKNPKRIGADNVLCAQECGLHCQIVECEGKNYKIWLFLYTAKKCQWNLKCQSIFHVLHQKVNYAMHRMHKKWHKFYRSGESYSNIICKQRNWVESGFKTNCKPLKSAKTATLCTVMHPRSNLIATRI